MTRKQRRTLLIGILLGSVGLATGLVLYALSDTIVFFYTPSDIATKGVSAGQRLRLGGIVAKGSMKKADAGVILFTVTDTIKTTNVSYKGLLPDLFREEQGVVAEGVMQADGSFVADSVLAKHDEKYMPPEVARALKEKGVWKGASK
jgi:cytochrome c-type biogenesis protein CcmE